MTDKNNIPKFFHRLRKESQKTIKVGFLFSDFNIFDNSISIILPYFEIKSEKISKTVFSINQSTEVPNELKENVDEWINFIAEDAEKVAQNIYDKKIDVLLVLSDDEFIKKVLDYHAAPVQIAGANALTLRDKIKNNKPYVDAIFGDNFIHAINKIDTIELNAAFCYLPTSDDNINNQINPSEITFGVLYDEKDKANDNRISNILDKVPNSKIKIFSDTFDNEKNRIIATKRLLKSKIPEKKIELISSNNLYKDILIVDIFLETESKSEPALILDLLYTGIPVISMTDIGRSILNTIGLSELGVNDENSYVNIAALIATDNELIKGLHFNLKNMMNSSLLTNIDEFAKNIKEVIFASFDYLLSLKNDIPSKEEFNILWDLVYNIGVETKENKLAIIDRIILTKPTNIEVLNYIAVTLSESTKENIKYWINYIPENTFAKKFLKFDLAFKEKDLELLQKLGPDIVDYKYNNYQEQYIISTVAHQLGEVYAVLGKLKEAAINDFKSVKMTPDQLISVKAQRYSDYLFTLHLTDLSSKKMFESAKGYGNIFKNVPKFSHKKKAKEKIRVGYISPDFRQHVVAYFSYVLFKARNPNKFETYAYMIRKESFKSDLFKTAADHYKCLDGLKNEEIAKIIYDDEIDILVDLAGHTAGSALPILAKKPAPIQICGIGYFATTGLPEVDYFLVDKYLAPETEDEFFIEKLLRLSHSHLCYIPIMPVPEKNDTIPFKRNNYITFGSMNDAKKINENVWKTWSKILNKVPNSKLFLKSIAYNDVERINVDKELLSKYSIDSNRVIFESASTDYLKKYNEMDIALDTFPYPGGGTTCDALMMKVPVVTLTGNSCHERFGKSIMYNIGLEELVANTIDEYIDIAVSLANDIPRLEMLHNEIYERTINSAVMNQKLYMKDLEEAYEKIYKEWLESDK